MKNEKINIKKYTIADEENLMNIIEAEGEEWKDYSAPEAKENYQKMLQQSLTYVAYENDALCGYSRSIVDGHLEIWVCDLLVTPKFRGKNIGRQLMECICNDYPNHAVYVMSDIDEYYKKQGYPKIGSIFQVSKQQITKSTNNQINNK
jgi:ribosomal protein S18 acetylase RimI-like enzyme